jgi:heme-degrading monooxygenase HmoA
MHARLITSQFQLDKLEEAGQLYRESILPEVRQLPGFKGRLVLVDRSRGKVIAITLWESEADARASGEGSAFMQASVAKFASFYAAPNVIEIYEVAGQE